MVFVDFQEQTPRRPKPLPAIRDLDDDDELIESQYWESLEVPWRQMCKIGMTFQVESWATSFKIFGMKGTDSSGEIWHQNK